MAVEVSIGSTKIFGLLVDIFNLLFLFHFLFYFGLQGNNGIVLYLYTNAVYCVERKTILNELLLPLLYLFLPCFFHNFRMIGRYETCLKRDFDSPVGLIHPLPCKRQA